MKLILFTAGCMLVATGLLLTGAYCHQGIEGIMSRLPVFQRHPGHHQASPAASPAGEHPYPALPAAQDQANADPGVQYAAWVHGVKPVRSEGPQPWATGGLPVLTDEVEAAIEAAQEKRAQLASSVLRQLAAAHDDQQPTGDDMQAALVALRAVPVPDPYEAPAVCAPAYGQVPVAEVLESERLAEAMQP
jgi:hypothetical protein